ncbi:RNAse H-fold protein YqgF [Chthonomonas calidirosea]|uniref:Putative pre-16S rRNA nuclease n=1 Tax=Chthonomonas calidirosea (strain DSM 23976 / ICMP 18418 / T49) TaxID=1303518 RepID=S0EYL9_CHTCT|nr:Holliday junction resolvase RuvX [Chthonomonas calidirosea]CCW35013.1 RNAse H-fold protein YqgF [Chthonomonas calidirosea T49]CEK20972.1 RNAse H-fold protein YqgF [Chthonomonas calidirosea]
MKILGLDVGEKTIGVAISDEEERWAFPVQTIVRQEGWRRDMAAIRALVASEKIGRIVVGLPLTLEGQKGVQAQKVEAFLQILRRNVRIPIEVLDERFTTLEAERVLRSLESDFRRRKEVVDANAACLILQTYLDRRQHK